MKALEVTGKDAAEFLHRLTASGVKKLGENRGVRGLLLTGQARMLAQFDLLRVGAHKYLLVAPEYCFEKMREELERLHFSEDVAFAVSPVEYGVRMGGGGGTPELEFALAESEANVSWPHAVPGFSWAPQSGGADAASSTGFQWSRIGALIPEAGRDWTFDNFALESGVLPWIDRNKGCYPGQEVVEKSINVGHPAKILQAYEQVGKEAPIDAMGVTSECVHDGGRRVLARVKWADRRREFPGFKLLNSHWN